MLSGLFAQATKLIAITSIAIFRISAPPSVCKYSDNRALSKAVPTRYSDFTFARLIGFCGRYRALPVVGIDHAVLNAAIASSRIVA